MWGSLDLISVRVVEIDLVFVCWPKINWFWCERGTWLRFCVGGRNWLNYGGSNLTWFQCRDRNWIGFGGGVKNDLVLVFGSKLSSSMGFEIDLFLVRGSELTWLLSGGGKWLRFIIVLIKIGLVYVGDRIWLDFSVGIGIDLVFCVGIEKYMVLVCGWKLTWVFVWRYRNDLILEWGSK